MTKQKGTYPSFQRRYPDEDPVPGKARDREETIQRLAPSRATVLLAGGSAEVKSRVARALHDRSPRAHHPFIEVDCAALASSAVERIVFGEPLSSASARGLEPRTRRGAIRDAEGGTLYVATIDWLPFAVQPRFLGFLDETRVVRVVVSSDADLWALACRGCFFADLGERLSLVRVDLWDSQTV
jgi:DNA-binding NtrC family response regulator